MFVWKSTLTIWLFKVLVLSIFGHSAVLAESRQLNSISRELIASGFIRPVFAVTPPGEFDRFFVVEQRGSAGTATRADIRIFNLTTRTTLAKPFLTVSPVATGNEQGLLGLAFHPDYQTNRFFFTYHTNSAGNNVITRWQTTAANPDSADPTSAATILTINHPSFSNHNGGWIGFGPDGYLYIATGDGGSGGDPDNHGQSLNSLLGKILRIDVDHGLPYTIPAFNPFAGGSEQQEIFYFGLRNPWRNSFDRQTGDLYIGDVGQNNWEEIDWRPANDSGNINFGWRLKEATHCYNPSTNCDPLGITTNPIYEYDHGQGCSVTGGYVYRGCMIPTLSGSYLFGDYCSGRIWSFRYNGVDTSEFAERTAELGGSISGLMSFAQDNRGEIYLLYQSGDIYRLTPPTPFNDCNNNHYPDSCDIALGTSLDANLNSTPDECENQCGDANGDSAVNISDAVYLIGYIFSGGPAPSPLAVGDVNCDSTVNISDAVYLIAYIFAAGSVPCANC
jgi:glucose/arabinose dehydrogenase